MNMVFYLLPHQDDETFVIPKITSDVRSGNICIFFYLTTHALPLVAKRRNDESRNFLKRLGIKDSQIYFIGQELNILDGCLHNHIGDVAERIKYHIGFQTGMLGGSIIEYVTPAFEGGHQDHDVAFVLASYLTKHWPAAVLEYFMYNGFRTKGRFYRVASPYAVSKTVDYVYRWTDLKALFLVPLIFTSQAKTMLGLWPFIFFKSLFRPLAMRRSMSFVEEAFHHQSSPLYERWNRITYKEFSAAVYQFISKIEKK